LLLVESAVGIAKIVTNTVAADAADGLVAATMGQLVLHIKQLNLL
jgi:hypothetical protein